MFCFVASGSLVSRIIQVDHIWLWSCWSVILHKIYRTFLLRFSHFWNSTYSSRTAMNHNVMWHLYCSKIKIGFTAPKVRLDSPMVLFHCENFDSKLFVKITANTSMDEIFQNFLGHLSFQFIWKSFAFTLQSIISCFCRLQSINENWNKRIRLKRLGFPILSYMLFVYTRDSVFEKLIEYRNIICTQVEIISRAFSSGI